MRNRQLRGRSEISERRKGVGGGKKFALCEDREAQVLRLIVIRFIPMSGWTMPSRLIRAIC